MIGIKSNTYLDNYYVENPNSTTTTYNRIYLDTFDLGICNVPNY